MMSYFRENNFLSYQTDLTQPAQKKGRRNPMAPRELSRIEPDKRQILEKYLSHYPVKVGKLADELGIAIKVSSLPTGVSGQIMRNGNQIMIRVNRHESRERQRFTIAHELAHFFLHLELIESSPEGIKDNVLYRSGAPEQIEFEANRLAAEIVMPIKQVRDVLSKRFNGIITDETVEALAEIFQVSKAAMEIRLSLLQQVA